MKGHFLGCNRLMLCAVFALCFVSAVIAQPRAEYRGFWVDTFNTTLNNHTDVVTVVNRAKAANANALFAQVRRRGDAWYITPLEPKFVNIAPGFDPLADLITVAHAEGIEVHAFVIMSAIHVSTPVPPAITLPASPLHVFNQHGGYDPVSQTIVAGPNNWLTRTLLPDSTTNGIGFQGHKFGNDFWLDFGHPDASAYTVNVLMHLVTNYAIDGLHLDRIRYPELTATGQTPTNGTNIGYNPVSVSRFNTRHGRIGNPATGDPLWMQWRRDQVTNIVRRLYLNVINIKPQVKMSGAFIAFGGGPTTEAAWNSAEAYWRVYQDWRAWTQEGIIDLAIPMDYKREHVTAQATQFAQWLEWTRNHQYNRAGLIGIGNFINPVEGSIRQVRSSLLPSTTTGNSAKGVVFFSMATSNAVATNGVTSTPIVNPFAIPPSITPVRSYAEFASGLATGASVNGLTRYEDPVVNPIAIFAQPATIPVHPWKFAPTKGHMMGFARRADSSILDTATVTFTNLGTDAIRTGATDGGGFYGGVDLDPGEYLVKAQLGPDTVYSCVSNVAAGLVTTAHLNPETVAPVTTLTVSPGAPNGSNGWYVTRPRVTLSALDSCSGVARTEYSTDNGATWIPYSGEITIQPEGTVTILFRSVDRAGNIETAGSQTFMIDLTDPTASLTANPSTIWPPNGQMVTVTIGGTGSDAISGLSQVSYVVTDEYGMPLSIGTRSLTGNSANWAETLVVEARRNGDDLDGRVYTVVATITDVAGRTSTATVTVTVLHDRRGPS